MAPATRNAALDVIRAALDAGSGPGTISFYDGVQPADAGVALFDNQLLGTLTCDDPSAPAAANGVLTLAPIGQDWSADASGVASFVRAQDSDGNVVFDADVGTFAATVIMPNTSITAGEPILISSFTITWP